MRNRKMALSAWKIITNHMPNLSIFVKGICHAEVSDPRWPKQYLLFWPEHSFSYHGRPRDCQIDMLALACGELKIYAKP